MSTPLVPPRPQRTQATHTAVKPDQPLIPPRPFRKTDPSPDREGYTRSPLNGPPTSLSSKVVRPRVSQDLPRRPPSVSLPDIGHEGEEYSSFDQLPPEAHGVSVETPGEQTKSVSPDLPMHQPKASLPPSSATKQIENVTGTDSIQAAAAGIGRARPADDVHKLPPGDAGTSSPLSRVANAPGEHRHPPSSESPLRTKASFNRSTPSLQPLERASSRPASIQDDSREHGIPEIGVQVPLLHMAGDVQMPTAGSRVSQHAPGIGFFNDGSGRAHHRKRSSRHEFGPPDSYGLHHDQQDQFEREWIRKHPEEAAKEGYYMHLPKPQTALTSEQLNRLVHQDEPATVGTPSTPDEQTADEYITRVISASQSPALGDRKKRTSSGSHAPDSPLRKSFAQSRLHPDDALEVDDFSLSPRRSSRAFDEDHEHEHADGTPILASDELQKRPSSAYMHAAVERDPDSYYDEYYDSDTGRNSRRHSTQLSNSRPSSRPSSRPGSIHGTAGLQSYHGGSLHRFVTHDEPPHSGKGTPLEEIEEYEPLFPENEKDGPRKEFKKRPELAHHHFPSRDIWEDSPASLQYSAEVSTPDLERAQAAVQAEQGSKASTFETPEQEQNRRRQNDLQNNMTSDGKTFMKPQFKAGVVEDMHRPGPHRFPSSDIWEDSPDSVHYVTTVGSSEEEAPTSPEAIRPSITAQPQRRSKLAEETKPPETAQPTSPEKAQAPTIPAKPSIPARPVRASKPEQSRSADGGETVKAKPPVPARPGGEKIAAMKAGFLNDLNNRLKVGPQGPPPKKEAEPEAEEEEQPKAPLADARKTRARGPARRRPAASPSSDRKSSVGFAFSPLIHCWSIDEENELQVHENEDAKSKETAVAAPVAEKTLEEIEEHNTKSAAPAGDIATEVVNSDEPGKTAARHRESASELKAALAEAGVAPASYAENAVEDESEEAVTTSQDTAVQTGETKVTTTQGSGEKEELTAYVDGAAQAGNVVVREDGNKAES